MECSEYARKRGRCVLCPGLEAGPGNAGARRRGGQGGGRVSIRRERESIYTTALCTRPNTCSPLLIFMQLWLMRDSRRPALYRSLPSTSGTRGRSWNLRPPAEIRIWIMATSARGLISADFLSMICLSLLPQHPAETDRVRRYYLEETRKRVDECLAFPARPAWCRHTVGVSVITAATPGI